MRPVVAELEAAVTAVLASWPERCFNPPWFIGSTFCEEGKAEPPMEKGTHADIR
jgi:hypothetical protein